MRKSGSIRLISTSLLASACISALASEAGAQVKRPMPDEHGVDVIGGMPIIPSGRLIIGQPSHGGLEFYRIWQGSAWYHNLQGAVGQNGSQFTVTVGPSVETFTLSGGVYQTDDGIGSTLTKAVNGTWTYTLADGTVITFENPGTLGGIQGGIKGLLRSITRPNGLVTIFTNKYQSFCEFLGPNCDTPPEYVARLQSVTTNTGYHLKLEYAQNFTTSTVKNLGLEENWLRMVKVTGINGAIDYCDPNANSCTSLTQSWPIATIAKNAGSPGNWTDVWADALANTTTGTVNSFQLNSIQSPADPSADFSIAYDGSGRVATFAQGGGTWTYGYADVGSQRTTTVTQPLGGSKAYVSDISLRKLISSTDELSRTTSYQYDSFVRPTRVTQPEGNYAEVIYDARGNVTQRRAVAKAGSGLADIVTSASFDASCSNPKTCNQPNSTTDTRGNVTDYTYDATHGGVLTATQPAPTVGAVRPQVRYTYATRQAYYKNSGGSIVASGLPIYLPTAASACQTLASCAVATDEVKVTTDYGPQVAGTANNLLPVSTSKGSGDGALTATITRAWDMFGNLTSVDGPLAGTADTWGFRYDADRRLTMRVSPDPDGAGILKFRAQRLTYNGDGNVTKVEAGTTTTLTGAFTPVASGERAELAYDALGRKSKQSLMSSTSTTNAVTQYSYDTKGRLSCTAVRMNSAIFGSLPSDACTLGTTGTLGPDRVTKSIYDNADEVTQAQVALGTTDQANERTLTYTANGQLQTLKDAENNLTTYEYDGFDRLLKSRFPNPTQGSGTSSTTDYEQLGYDPNSNVTSRRLRDGNSIAFTFDNLNRVTLKNLPGSEPDVTFGYDNLGRLTSAAQTGSSVAFTYDALSRKLTETGPNGTMTSAWNLAGRRTRLTWQDAFYVDYDYLVTGEMWKVRENGATSGLGLLATYGYDDQGRRISVTRGNGANSSYTYDAVSRLASLTHDLAGTTADLAITNIAYNPASQITGETRSDAYAFSLANQNTSGVANGLNQLSSVGGTSASHDAKGNLTSDPVTGKSYGYSSENLLTSASGGGGPNVTLAYDPLLRLSTTSGGLYPRGYQYDGLDTVGLWSAGTMSFRYVPGPGEDEPVAEYYVPQNRREWFHADERGSIMIVSGDDGTMQAWPRYDEYGNAQNPYGLYGYTGQLSLAYSDLPELHYYKARIYAPHLGRFLQADPIGYDSGPNLYAYVLNDPVNLTDPLGLDCTGVSPEAVLVCGKRLTIDPGGGSVTDTFRGGLPSPAFGSPSFGDNSEAIVITYWRKERRRGNPVARWGLRFSLKANIDWATGQARNALLGAILNQPVGRAPKRRYPTMAEAMEIYEQIRVALMYADMQARTADRSGVPGLLSAGQVYDYHAAVLSEFGIPMTAFAGSFTTGTRFEAIRSGYLPMIGWCRDCDR